MMRMHLIRVEGTVQGVGFRPTVWRIANAMRLAGSVRNDGTGVVIEIFCSEPSEFLSRLRAERPPLARIDRITVREAMAQPPAGFTIRDSGTERISTAIAADAATCPECLAETLDPASRRHLYPFTNCTHCGPRLSIVRHLPYDRHNTTMAAFVMCDACRAEYEDPSDRRYHAQPIACPACGPHTWFEAQGQRHDGDGMAQAAGWIADGRIVAVKGLGGFQLACDATQERAVALLRARKNRSRKPLALMVADLDAARAIAQVGEAEAAMLLSPAAPIVLLQRRDTAMIAGGVAPGFDTLGIMLPPTPLHHILMRAVGRPIVLTSGNRSDDPQETDDKEALAGLAGIADGFLLHDREIAQRVDDSVVRLCGGQPVILRRGRGFAPEPVLLHDSFRAAPAVLGMGGDLKGAVALGRNGAITLSQHLGDLATRRSRLAYEETLSLMLGVNDFAPAGVAVDAHPEFHSHREGGRIAADLGIAFETVQHHHAHVASAMAEAGLALDHPPVLGLVLDGMGLGADGTVWGGEFLTCSFASFERLAHFNDVPLPGGDLAARQPWRNAFAHLDAVFGWENVTSAFGDVVAVQRLAAKPLPALAKMIASGVNAPPCTSAGRLLDACAALLGVCFEEQDFEGEAPSLLEALAARSSDPPRNLGVTLKGNRVCWDALFAGLLRGLQEGRTPASLARDIHETIAQSCTDMALKLAREQGLSHVALSGGCFANLLLLRSVVRNLQDGGLTVLTQQRAPVGDGGLALGQCAVVMARLGSRTP